MHQAGTGLFGGLCQIAGAQSICLEGCVVVHLAAVHVGVGGAVDDDIRAVDCTEIDDFISICNVQFIKIRVQCFNLHWIKHIIQGASNLSAGTCNPYF